MFKPKLSSMQVHSATCSCSVELYKLRYTLVDLLPNWNFRGVFSTYRYLIYIAGRISAAAMAGYILFFSLAGPVGDYNGAHTAIFRGVFVYTVSLSGTVERHMPLAAPDRA